MGLKQITHEKFGVNDLVRITANTSMHGFAIGKLVVITGAAERESDGSIILGAVDEIGTVWSITEGEIELYEKYDPAVDAALLAAASKTEVQHVH
jgi:hypothetical protein